MTQYTFALALLAAFGLSVGHATTDVDLSALDLDANQKQQSADLGNPAAKGMNASQSNRSDSNPSTAAEPALSVASSTSSFAEELPSIPADFDVIQKEAVKHQNLNNVPGTGTMGKSASAPSFDDLGLGGDLGESNATASNATSASAFDAALPAPVPQAPVTAEDFMPDLSNIPDAASAH
ncbi:MAG: hypothetical protein CNLJKLNK_00544 [Holosporales bacterium]